MGSGGQGGGGAFGGAIYQAAGASLLEDCSFTGNRARGGSGGQGLGAILMVPNPGGPGGGASGGAIVNGGGSGMQLNRCTLSVNAASGGSAGFPSGTSAVSGAGSGGAILGTGTFTNCTVSQNAASGTNANGGGISASAGTILHCTIVANSAASAGGVTSGPSLKNTLVTGNTPADSAGAVNSLGHNLFGTSAGITGLDASDLRDVAALLGPLQDNGGPTMTYALLANSPALNAGDNTGAPASDQRGESRPQGATVDIGAFEASALAILVGGKPALPGAYTRTSPATVSFETIFPASAIRYTLDGSTPTLASTPYTAPFSVAATQTIRAAAFDAGLANPVFAGPVLLSFGPARTLTLNTTGLGAIVRSPTSEAYPDGAVVSLTAIPIAGWLFQGWSGDIAGNASPTTVTMNSNKTIQATFVPGPSYSLSVTPAGQGTVSFDTRRRLSWRHGDYVHRDACVRLEIERLGRRLEWSEFADWLDDRRKQVSNRDIHPTPDLLGGRHAIRSRHH